MRPDGALIGRLLLARIKAGDASAFDEVYGKLRPRLYSFLVRLAGNRSLAEDLLQETWLRFARSARRLDDDTDLAAWLFTVARNLFVSHRRWRMLDLERVAELALFARDPPPSPFEAAAANETEARLERAIAALPVPYREVILLVGVEHMEPAEAATILGLKPDALRQRLRRARVMLEEKMAPILNVSEAEDAR